MDNENFAKRIKKEYFEVTLNEIAEFLVEKSRSQKNTRYIKDLANYPFPQPWFGDYSKMLDDLEEKIERSPIQGFWEKCPWSFRQKPLHFIDELAFLLPKIDCVKTFLPVLIISYATNRRCQIDSITNILSPYSNLFASVYYGFFAPSSKELERYKKLFTLRPFKTNRKKLDLNSISVFNYARILYPFSVTILFLHILLFCRDICNVTLSFYLFESMANTLRLFGPDADYILDQINEYPESFTLKDDIVKNDICKFAELILDQTYSVWDTLDPNIRIADNYQFLYKSLTKIREQSPDNKIGDEVCSLIINLSKVLNESWTMSEKDAYLQRLVDSNIAFLRKNHIDIPIPKESYPTDQSSALIRFICGLHKLVGSGAEKSGTRASQIIENQIEDFNTLRSDFLSPKNGKVKPEGSISDGIYFDSE